MSPPASLGDFLGLQLPGCPHWHLPPLSRPRALPALHRLDLKDVPSAIRLVAPDLGVLAASSLCLGVCRRRTQKARRSQRAQEPVRDGGAPVSQPSEDYFTFSFFLPPYLFLSKNVDVLVVKVRICPWWRDSTEEVKCTSPWGGCWQCSAWS